MIEEERSSNGLVYIVRMCGNRIHWYVQLGCLHDHAAFLPMQIIPLGQKPYQKNSNLVKLICTTTFNVCVLLNYVGKYPKYCEMSMN
jgi:hypothetical protein